MFIDILAHSDLKKYDLSNLRKGNGVWLRPKNKLLVIFNQARILIFQKILIETLIECDSFSTCRHNWCHVLSRRSNETSHF